MTALPLPLVRAALHPFYRLTFRAGTPWPVQRALLDAFGRLVPMPRGTTVRPVLLSGRPAERIDAGPAAGPGTVLYLHGGGYTVGSLATHRSLAGHLATATRRPVHLLDYRLAPEHPYPAAIEDAITAFEALGVIAQPDTVVLGGDSAGGAIALAAAQQLVGGDSGRPGALVLISPWADPNLRAERRRDLVTNREWGFACGAAYLGGGDPADPRYAPLLGSMTGLPPTYLHTNTGELLYPQCLQLAALLRRAGVPLRYVESDELWHAAQAQAGLVRAAADSVRDIAGFLAAVWAGTVPGAA